MKTADRDKQSKFKFAENIYLSTIMLLSDRLSARADALFFYSRSHGDDENLFELVSDLYKKKIVENVLVTDSDGRRVDGNVPGEAWPGKEDWMRRLSEIGINKMQLSGEAYHTKSETNAFLTTMKENNWKSAVIVAQPHQILRAMLTVVKSMSENNNWIRVYTMSPKSTSWSVEVFGSQGKKKMPRKYHINEEFDRIIRYQQSGDLASFDELFSYLSKRENMV